MNRMLALLCALGRHGRGRYQQVGGLLAGGTGCDRCGRLRW